MKNKTEEVIENLFRDMVNKYGDFEKIRERLQKEVQKICSFEISITYCEGDGHLILNENTSDVAGFDCLKGKSSKNKLTEDEFERNTF